MPLFLNLDFFFEKAATAERWRPHAVLLFFLNVIVHVYMILEGILYKSLQTS